MGWGGDGGSEEERRWLSSFAFKSRLVLRLLRWLIWHGTGVIKNVSSLGLIFGSSSLSSSSLLNLNPVPPPASSSSSSISQLLAFIFSSARILLRIIVRRRRRQRLRRIPRDIPLHLFPFPHTTLICLRADDCLLLFLFLRRRRTSPSLLPPGFVAALCRECGWRLNHLV